MALGLRSFNGLTAINTWHYHSGIPGGRLAQLARAPPLQGGGHWFEPSIAHLSFAPATGALVLSHKELARASLHCSSSAQRSPNQVGCMTTVINSTTGLPRRQSPGNQIVSCLEVRLRSTQACSRFLQRSWSPMRVRTETKPQRPLQPAASLSGVGMPSVLSPLNLATQFPTADDLTAAHKSLRHLPSGPS